MRIQLRVCGFLALSAAVAAWPVAAAPPAAAAAETTAAAAAPQTIGEQREAVLFWSQAEREARFRAMYRRFPSDRAAHGARVHALPAGAPLRLDGEDGAKWLDAYMAKYHLAGVMVLEDGRVRLERRALGFTQDERWTSFSVAKSVTSVLLGVALKQGLIHGMDDKLPRYIPELAGTAYADVTVHQLLTMTSGVRWNEDYADPRSDVARMYRGACVDGRAHVLSYLAKLPREWPPGTHWNYNTAETDLLGILVQRAAHRPLATLLAQAIWQPYGMASDAYWIKDECDGSDTGGSGLSATLADYARFGQFMLDGGRVDGRPVIAEAWLDGAVRPQASVDAPERGYGYLWWTGPDGSYAAIGIFGQMVYVDPARRLVIAQVGAWPHATSRELTAARSAFVSTVQRAVDAERARQGRP